MAIEIVLLGTIITLIFGFGLYQIRILHDIDKTLSNIHNWSRETLPLLIKTYLKEKSHNPNSRRDELLAKMESGELTLEEARELRGILDKELQEAKKKEDFAKVMALLLFLAFMAYAISRR